MSLQLQPPQALSELLITGGLLPDALEDLMFGGGGFDALWYPDSLLSLHQDESSSDETLSPSVHQSVLG